MEWFWLCSTELLSEFCGAWQVIVMLVVAGGKWLCYQQGMRFCHYELLGVQWMHVSMRLDVLSPGVAQLGNFGHCCRKYVTGQGRGRIPVHGTNSYRKNKGQEGSLNVCCCSQLMLYQSKRTPCWWDAHSELGLYIILHKGNLSRLRGAKTFSTRKIFNVITCNWILHISLVHKRHRF